MSKFAEEHDQARLLKQVLVEYPERVSRTLAEFILSGEPQTPALRSVIGELCEPTKLGRPAKPWRADIAFFVEARMQPGKLKQRYEDAIADAAKQFDVKDTTVKTAYAKLKQVRREHGGLLAQFGVQRPSPKSKQVAE